MGEKYLTKYVFSQEDIEKLRKIFNTGGFIPPKPNYKYPQVEKIIFNMKDKEKPATIVFFTDGDKVVVKCCEGEMFNREVGVAMALIRKWMPNRSEFLRLVDNASIQI